MARITAVKGYQYLIQVGDGASTEVFTHPVLINSQRSLQWSVNTDSAELPDATDQSILAEMVRSARSTDFKVDGAGLVHATDVEDFIDWAESGEAKNVKISQKDGATTVWTRTYPMILESFSVTADRSTHAECSITLVKADAQIA